MKRTGDGESDVRCCSFCRKPEGPELRLFSNPSAFPRAYICQECVAVWARVLKEPREQAAPDE
jgi:ATP-dependent Clp protease ATP-binding subunit ClpX